MPVIEAHFSALEANAVWRNQLEQPLTGADKKSLAQYLGVTVRTVQRWTTAGAQQRNAVPTRLQGQPFAAWPPTYQRRADVAYRIARGGVSDNPPPAVPASFNMVRGTLPAADEWAGALERDLLDPWLSAAWTSYTMERSARGWLVVVRYDATVSPKVKPVPEPVQ